MVLNNDELIADGNKNTTCQQEEGLSIVQTCISGIIMGAIAYSGSFSLVPILFTITTLIFGSQSLITIITTGFSQIAGGYLHTHSSRTGMAVSTRLFHGFYIAEPTMRNRRQYDETRWQSVKRFFILVPINALVLNLMWQTFTVYYLIQSELFKRYIASSTSHEIENERKNKTLTLSAINELEPRLLLIHGITRYLAGCLSGMSTGLINHLWQRRLAHRKIPNAIFNTDTDKLKLKWRERKKLLSPYNIENWIKASTMVIGALFFIASNVPNVTGFHLLSTRNKKLISDVLVINAGWFFIRDCEVLLLKRPGKAPKIPLNTAQSSLIVEQTKSTQDEQSKMLTMVA